MLTRFIKSAERFMHVAARFKLDKLSNLEIDVSALYLIAEPKTPEPVRAAIISRNPPTWED
jgi:hypothetical protein